MAVDTAPPSPRSATASATDQHQVLGVRQIGAARRLARDPNHRSHQRPGRWRAARVGASEVAGQWESAARFSGALDPVTGKFAGLEPDQEPRRTARDGAGVVTLLPKQLWSSLKVSGDGEDGEVVCEVGWLLGHGSAVTSTCVLSRDGDVKVIIFVKEEEIFRLEIAVHHTK
ncbi:hypothetical protein TRIUR3_16800 [Triticum urartu]|uniref:Uncharacterized protein n=1 Tax=Triticum urartu TaxID=4572 RepID=M7ZIQ7_TRIUA|nr:hypothetical protein TRIUR3_16800 [Triticum urartu]